MEAKMEPLKRKSLVFFLNGSRVELTQVDPSMTLITYLRTHARLPGTKLGCGEGGCGACVVHLSRHDPLTNQVRESTINSCLALLCSLHGCSITTIEGLGSVNSGLHAVQKRFAGFHASQCGYCTPGMCMSVYGHIRQSISSQGDDSSSLEQGVNGNICRCTGYRPILDVCKSFSANVDLEDLGVNTFWKRRDHALQRLLPSYKQEDDPRFPQQLVNDGTLKNSELVEFSGGDGHVWLQARSVEEAVVFRRKVEDGSAEFVVGNTSAGVYKSRKTKTYVDVSRIAELLVLRYGEAGAEVGAAVTISKLVDFLEEVQVDAYRSFARHLRKVASVHVRNRASVGGNVIMAKRFSFDSDVATLLLGVGAKLKLVSAATLTGVVMSMEEFFDTELAPETLLVSIIIPNVSSDSCKFRTYRASPRPLGNAVSLLNAAFLCQFTVTGGEAVIENVRLAYGAFGGDHAVRAESVEDYLQGKRITPQVILEAVNLLKVDLVMKKGTSKASYRESLASAFLYKFLAEFTAKESERFKLTANGTHSAKLSSSTQTIHMNDEYFPVGQPSSKLNVELQTTGEAVYVDDIPSPADCLHAAFVYSNKAYAKIKQVRLEKALSSQGAVAFVNERDIPSRGDNVAYLMAGYPDPLFAVDTVHFIGELLGVLVADTASNARAAAAKVEVEYDLSLGPPITTIEEAVARESYLELWPFAQASCKRTVGDVSKGFARGTHRVQGEVRVGSQYHFYMETQAALAVPDEDNCITVYSSTQGSDDVQLAVSRCLGIPMHNVRIITRRLGGGFGGKVTKSCLVATACALAAFKLRRPVRISLDRRTDMIINGGRHNAKAVYDVGFTSDGKITALKLDVFAQAGWNKDLSSLLPLEMPNTLMKYDWGALDLEVKMMKTNLPGRTAQRAPGSAQGSFIADVIIEHVAASLNMNTHEVVEKNIHSLHSLASFYSFAAPEDYSLPLIWNQLKETTGLAERQARVEEFNAQSTWLKRGLCMIPCVYIVGQAPQPARVSVFSDCSVVVEVGGIEMGQGLWTKVKQTAVYALNKLWRKDEAGGVDISSIRIVQLDSISLPNTKRTAASSTSEGSCEAVIQACGILVDRLMPVKEKQVNATWSSLIRAAYAIDVDLSAQSRFSPGLSRYVTCGAALTEVEVDALTGETTIMQTDILYDCGKSMNPAVDIGQVEGAFVHGLGYFTTEDYVVDGDGRLVTDGTWTYKPPTIDNVPKRFNIELLNSVCHHKRILSSKASGEPPLLLASSVHGAIRNAIKAARQEVSSDKSYFGMDSPATVDRVKQLCGFDNVEQHLQRLTGKLS